MTRKEINQQIKDFIANDSNAKKHFSKDGKSYTQLSSDVLIDMISTYKSSTSKKVTKDEFKKDEKKVVKKPSKNVSLEDRQIKGFVQTEATNKKQLKEIAEKAIEEVKQEWKDADKIVAILKTLDTITNPNVRTLITKVRPDLEDIAYTITTGKPRIDNLKNKNLMQELFNDSALELKQY